MGKKRDISGMRFGRLQAIRTVGKDKKGNYLWECKCDCKKTIVSTIHDMESGRRVSCGCYRNELTSIRSKTHGESKTRLYKSWKTMKHRCFNIKYHAYKHYGGRGITVCEDWQSFEVFRTWALSNGYNDSLTIERRNTDGNYCPENCTWIPKKDQPKNRRLPVCKYADGKRLSLKALAKSLGVKPSAIYYRLNTKGMNIDDALEQILGA